MRKTLGPFMVYAYHDYGPGEGPLYIGAKVAGHGIEVCHT